LKLNKVSVIVPALNEAQTISKVVSDLVSLKNSDGKSLISECIVANNGSTDDTSSLALASGATVIDVLIPGYGQACWVASQQASGDILVFVDGDGAVDVHDVKLLLAKISQGADLVIGVRTNADPGSMTRAQRIGNRFACLLMNLIWGMQANDLGPLRAIRAEAFAALAMQDRGYGWTVEMQVRAHAMGLSTAEVEVNWRARSGGVSKVSGNLYGAIGAGVGILGMIFRIWIKERNRSSQLSAVKT
jgi:glycosyltransferase involved in cell wall biosynthesis